MRVTDGQIYDSEDRASIAHLSAKNYQNWWKFDKVLTKTNLHSFLRHGVCAYVCVYTPA